MKTFFILIVSIEFISPKAFASDEVPFEDHETYKVYYTVLKDSQINSPEFSQKISQRHLSRNVFSIKNINYDPSMLITNVAYRFGTLDEEEIQGWFLNNNAVELFPGDQIKFIDTRQGKDNNITRLKNIIINREWYVLSSIFSSNDSRKLLEIIKGAHTGSKNLSYNTITLTLNG